MDFVKQQLIIDGTPRAGSVLPIDLPTQCCLHKLVLILGDDGTASNGNASAVNTTLDKLIENLQIKINTKDIMDWGKGSRINSTNSRRGSLYAVSTSGTAGQAAYRVYLTIYFYAPWNPDVNERFISSLNLGRKGSNPITSCQCYIKFRETTVVSLN